MIHLMPLALLVAAAANDLVVVLLDRAGRLEALSKPAGTALVAVSAILMIGLDRRPRLSVPGPVAPLL